METLFIQKQNRISNCDTTFIFMFLQKNFNGNFNMKNSFEIEGEILEPKNKVVQPLSYNYELIKKFMIENNIKFLECSKEEWFMKPVSINHNGSTVVSKWFELL